MKKMLLIMFFMTFVSVGAFSQSNDQDDAVYQVASESARFPGEGNEKEKIMKFITENLKYPAAAKAAGVQGRVIVKFIVERDGSLSNISVVKPLGHGCSEEAIRLVKSMPKWQPAKNDGKAVRVSQMLPIPFQLPKE